MLLDPLNSFYSGRRVLITGHTGFKGCWLSVWLQSLGAEVCGYSLEPETEPSLFTDAELAERLASSRIGDIRDFCALSSYYEEVRPEIVFHLAAQALVRKSYAAPVETFATNVLGTVNCLEAARQCASVRTTLVVTSDKCYEAPPPPGGYRETDPMGGFDPYSASKGAAELAVAAYYRSFFAATGRAVVSARAGNVIGGGDWGADRLVPDIVRAVLAGEPVAIRNPTATRPWQHVLDALHGYLLLAKAAFKEPSVWSRGWNLGPPADESLTVRDVTERLLTALGRGSANYGESTNGPHEAGTLLLNSKAARERLGWETRLSFAQSVDWTAKWYADWAVDRARAYELVNAQIETFMQKLE